MRDFAISHQVFHCYVEDYAFSRRSSSVTKLAELGGHARCEFLSYGRVLTPVPASAARKLLLGKLPRKDAKVAVQAALYGADALLNNDNECNAFAVANFGLSEQGCVALTLA